jgi:hypothetical protein
MFCGIGRKVHSPPESLRESIHEGRNHRRAYSEAEPRRESGVALGVAIVREVRVAAPL